MKEILRSLRNKWLAVGLAGTAAAVAGYFVVGPSAFYQAWLMAFLYVLAFAAGGLGLLMIHHLASGRWSHGLRRVYESAVRTFPFVLIFFLPLIPGMRELYPWVDPSSRGDAVLEHVMHHKKMYLNQPGFLARAAVYFAIWIGLGVSLVRASRQQDRTIDPEGSIARRMRMVSGPGLVVFGLATTFAAFDWAMSVEPKWYSALYGATFMVGQGLSALCLCAVVARFLARDSRYAEAMGPQQFHDIGNMIFAFTILWAYMNLSQLVIIWSGNLPEEIEYYLHRSYAPWPTVAVVLALLHFAVPFFLLLFKVNKRNPNRLAAIALLLLVMRFVDVFWTIAPAYRYASFHISWVDAAAAVGLTGLWLAAFFGALAKPPLLPLNDPRFTFILKPCGDRRVPGEARTSHA